MRAVGFLCGVGSLLWEARALGFKVVGNVDTRSYFRDGRTWRLNFSAPFHARPDVKVKSWYGADLAIGHPPCGSHSILGQTRVARDRPSLDREKFHARRAKNAGLLPLFGELVNEYQPKVFALDNLPKIMTTVAPPEWWEEALPGYRMTYLTIMNWDYGSCQTRERLWVIGTKRPLPRFKFAPIGRRPPVAENVWEALDGLPWEPWRDVRELTHIHLQPSDRPLDSYWLYHGKKYEITLKSDAAAQGFLRLPPGYNWPYVSKRGLENRKPGKHRMTMDRASVFGAKDVYHPLTGWPLTPRERARVMGWPDEFRLWDVERWGWTTTNYRRLIVATGKAVPSHFPRWLLPQLKALVS